MKLFAGWKIGLRRMEWIVRHFSKLDEVDRRYILDRLAADHAKMSSANSGGQRPPALGGTSEPPCSQFKSKED